MNKKLEGRHMKMVFGKELCWFGFKRCWSEGRVEGSGVIWDFGKGNKERGRRFVGALCKLCTNEWLIVVTFCGFL
jgi:hypothetical protein